MLVTLYVLPWLGNPFSGTHWPSQTSSFEPYYDGLGATKNQMNSNSWEPLASTEEMPPRKQLLLRQLLSSVQVTSVTGWLEIVSPSGVSSGGSPAPPGPGVQQTGKEQRGTRAVSLPQVDITPIVSMDELPEAKASELPRFPIKKVVGTHSIEKFFSILALWNTIYSPI